MQTGLFTLSPSHATSPLGIPPSSISALAYNLTTPDIVLPPGSPHRDSGTRLARTHGILYAVTALAVAPFDSLIAAIFLGSRRVKARARKGGWERWGSWLHGVTGAGYFAFVVGGLVPGVIVGREHVNVSVSYISSPFLFCLGVLFGAVGVGGVRRVGRVGRGERVGRGMELGSGRRGRERCLSCGQEEELT